MIELHVLTVDDWRLWRELRLAALAEAPHAFASTLADWQGNNDREERWRARLAIPGSYNVLTLLDGEPTGMASGVLGPEEGVVELISLWVGKASRGQGLGDYLVQAIVRWAGRGGAELVRLAVSSTNTHAIALYRRHGFRDTGRFGDTLPDGATEHIMEKRLSSGRASEGTTA
ncbi:N-acetyltransferase [Streptomyces nojiriensis]|uniref:N-acetyltransferase n=1 Tax=Streptomyces nojiriensis TaxID=66374 RepID=A0ABQ3SHK2_9ACTN|nr:GNAT family N-acetyltransferase [Streptomyces nojiriensis]QTI49238.1 Mycothiol acetyltransferase [Streptomyces nojiriensis]GGS10375.1 N-acetyltransferase [Streptomyces nojiriensis]GHI67611.1 N-acetyltransferase [Streptomyces nojiriensis]